MSVTVQAIPQEPSPASLNNEFYVPNILTFNLKKTSGDRLQETDSPSSSQNGDPFLTPVEHTIESNKENPVLKALLHGKSPQGLSQWNGPSRTPITSCHPFKKTEFSHDLMGDDTPVQVPKSLIKKPSIDQKSQKDERKDNKLDTKALLKKFRMSSELSISSASGVSFTRGSKGIRTPSPDRVSAEKDTCDLSIFNRKKKVISQSAITTGKPRVQYINSDRLIQLRATVDNAIKNHKVYSMTGCYYSVRNALKQRGWIEKIDNDVKGKRKTNRYEDIALCKFFYHNTTNAILEDPNTKIGMQTSPVDRFRYNRCQPHQPSCHASSMSFLLSCRPKEGDGLIAVKYQTVAAMRLSMQTNSGFAHSDQIRYTGQGEAEIINKMLRNVTEDLCWLSRPYPYYCWKDFDKFEMVNRLPRAYFSNKVGLCNSLQQMQWFYESGVCSTKFPRTYNMSTNDEVEAFKEDFRLTACIGVLKWFLQAFKNGGEHAVRAPDGKVEMSVIEFALRRCSEFVKTKQHEDIDILETPTIWEYQWDQFITQYYKIVNDGQVLKDEKEGLQIKSLVANVQSMLNILKPYWPQFDIEGHQNFWIVKPGGRCCGAGIVIRNNLEQILITINPNSLKETRFIVQKYIERPLLIYNTKFDIRQWFLVTNVYPLTIWMYKESYLRFCSQPFTLKNTHESIHLCNNAVQRKYKNGKRDRGLPDENMWDCYTFQTYLKAIGHPEAWEKYIYPGMKESFVGALLASQDSMERKKNCFELYGADFMISECLTDGPWLIEINSNPAMDSSTSVTARMCPQVLEDIIKVVVDRRDNKSAPTGAFEMVFRQNCPPIPSYLGMSLCVKGKKAFKSSTEIRALSRKSKAKKSSESVHYTDTEEESTAEEIISVTEDSSETSQNIKEINPAAGGSTGKISTSDTSNKRRKTDWVRKNIEDVRSLHSIKESKTFIASSSSAQEHNETCPKQILKVLKTLEAKQLVKDFKESKSPPAGEMKFVTELEDLYTEEIQKSRKSPAIDFAETVTKIMGYCQPEGDLSQDKPDFSNFDLAFEKELQLVEEKLEQSKSSDSSTSFFSARSNTSLGYFKAWKSKLYETRKTCEEMLAQLHSFQETQSKVKFQEAIKKRLKDEVDFVNRLKQHRKCKEIRKTKKDEKFKSDDHKSKFWDCEGGLAPLAINSENGAVRNINYSLPKIKQRSRPLLPNGSSEHGRKIDVGLEQTCCH